MIATRPRVVFDCNVLIQAISNGNGPAGKSFALLEANQIAVFVSRPILRELRSVLEYPAVRQKLHGLTDERVEAFIQRLVFRGTLVHQVPHVFDYPRAKQDEPYVDLAVAAEADFLVSRDNDLLDLASDHSLTGKEFRQRFRKLSVVNPVKFTNLISVRG